MKKLGIFIAASALTLSLAACGSVLPGTWLQREHSAHTTTVLEYDAIPVAILIIYDRTLSHAVESGKLRFQNHLLFVKTRYLISTIAHFTTRMSLWPRNHQERGGMEIRRFLLIHEKHLFCCIKNATIAEMLPN